VFQQFNLVRRLSALDNVLAGRLATAPLWRVVMRTFAKDDVERAAEALAAVGLTDHLHQRADTLSGGQQQRVAIARALAQESRILLADEPVASLDPGTAVSILTLMREIAHARDCVHAASAGPRAPLRRSRPGDECRQARGRRRRGKKWFAPRMRHYVLDASTLTNCDTRRGGICEQRLSHDREARARIGEILICQGFDPK